MKITEKHIFFWKEAYSQWHMSDFKDPISNITFICAEQYMMYHKAMLFGDTETATKILEAKTPKEHKALGRSAKGYNQELWDENKFNIVRNASMLKFTQNLRLLVMLLETGNKTLVEASPLDPIWGIAMDENAEGIDNPDNWKGENLLGYALTDTRDYIREILFNKENLFEI